MEPQTVPSSPAPETKLHNPPLNNPAKKLLLVILGTAVLAGSTLLGIQIGQSKKIDTQPVAGSTPTTISADPTPSPTDIDNNLNTSSDWRTAKFGGLFSYEYPAGWHCWALARKQNRHCHRPWTNQHRPQRWPTFNLWNHCYERPTQSRRNSSRPHQQV